MGRYTVGIVDSKADPYDNNDVVVPDVLELWKELKKLDKDNDKLSAVIWKLKQEIIMLKATHKKHLSIHNYVQTKEWRDERETLIKNNARAQEIVKEAEKEAAELAIKVVKLEKELKELRG